MIPKLDVVRIVYTRPETPAARVKYSASQAASVVTPTRKRRKHIPAATNAPWARHRQVAVLPSAQAKPTPTITPDESPPENGMYCLDANFESTEPSVEEYMGGADLGGAEFQAGGQPDEFLSLDEAKFMFFVEAVNSDQCSLLQLTEDLFISNDWNMARDEAFVGVIIVPILILTTQVKRRSSSPGSTFKVFGMVKHTR